MKKVAKKVSILVAAAVAMLSWSPVAKADIGPVANVSSDTPLYLDSYVQNGMGHGTSDWHTSHYSHQSHSSHSSHQSHTSHYSGY